MDMLDYLITRKEEKTMKKIRLVAAVAAMAMALSACGANAELKKTAMKIGDTKITAGDIAVMTKADMAYMGSDFATVKPMIVEQMETIFQYGELAKAMKIELTDEERNSAVSMRASYAANGGGFDAYSEYLKNNASSIDFLDNLFTASAYATKVQEQIAKEFEGKEATDEELKSFYEEKYYAAKHILVNKPEEGAEVKEGEKQGKELADELLERAKNGEDFDALVKEYSQDPGSESNPDGYVFTDGEMVAPFENKVKELKPGEFGMCESDYGYHVILRVELPAFEDKKDTVSSSYSAKRVELRFEELLKEHNITIEKFQDVIDAITEDMLTEQPVKEDEVSLSY